MVRDRVHGLGKGLEIGAAGIDSLAGGVGACSPKVVTRPDLVEPALKFAEILVVFL